MPEIPSFIRNENNREDENKKQKVDRRLFLGSLLGMAASGMSSGCAKKFREIQRAPFISADVFLDSFPEKIPGAKKIEKYPVKGAKYCLVHIRQRHKLSFNQQLEGMSLSSDEDHSETIEVQKNIEKVLSALRAGSQSIKIYCEGCTPIIVQNYETKKMSLESGNAYYEDWVDASSEHDGDIEASEINFLSILLSTLKDDVHYLMKKQKLKLIELEDRLQEVEQRFKHSTVGATEQALIKDYKNNLVNGILEEIGKVKDEYHALIEGKQKDIENTSSELRPLKQRASYLYGADRKMFFEGKATLLPVMSDEFYEQEMKGRSLAKSLENDAVDKRESELLRIIAESGEPIAYTVYGGAHEWTDPNDTLGGEDNVQQWNKKNPDRKFSLIEITPEGYEWD